jgi:NAD(P)-dependent dehydrogenase (short-subunit alcohol dehydrogenase family)
MQNFEGRVAVITGGASGIGLALARRFATAGMHIVIGDVETEALDRAVSSIDGAIGVRCDVTDPAQMQELADAAVDAFGAVHVFCNNAGVGGGGLSWEAPLSTWEWVLGVNLWGVIHGIRTFVPILVQQDEGHIVNTASVAGLVAAPMMGPYNASKHAVVALSETLHHEFAITGVSTRVSVLCPGWVRTNIATSERNRPTELADDLGVADVEQSEMARQVLAGMIENGMPPDEVAGRVFDAVATERFWVLTHDDDDMWMRAVNGRIDSLSARSNPEINLLG